MAKEIPDPHGFIKNGVCKKPKPPYCVDCIGWNPKYRGKLDNIKCSLGGKHSQCISPKMKRNWIISEFSEACKYFEAK